MDQFSARAESAFGCLENLRAGCMLGLWNLFWLFFIGLSAYFLNSSWQLAQNGQPAVGTVVALDESSSDGSTTYSPIVEYELGGQKHRFNSGLSSSPPAYVVGEQVSIRYNPANPAHAEIDAWWAKPPLYIALFAVMAGAALLTNVLIARRIWRGEGID